VREGDHGIADEDDGFEERPFLDLPGDVERDRASRRAERLLFDPHEAVLEDFAVVVGPREHGASGGGAGHDEELLHERARVVGQGPHPAGMERCCSQYGSTVRVRTRRLPR